MSMPLEILDPVGAVALVALLAIGLYVSFTWRIKKLNSTLHHNEQISHAVDQFALVSIADRAGRILEVNDAFISISGYSREELVGKNHRVVKSNQQPADFWPHVWATISSGKRWRGEVCNRAKSGRLYWVDTQILPVTNAAGKIEKYLSLRVDITARKLTELALSESQAFVERATHIAGVGAWKIDLSSESLQWSAQTCRIFDLPEDHQVTMEEAMSFYAPEARATMQTLIDTAVFTGEPWDVELPLTTAQGRQIWVRSIGVIEKVNGLSTVLSGAIQDVTQRRKLEANLQQQNQLMHTIIENLPCGLSVADTEMNMIQWNRQFAQLLEFPDELVNADPLTFESLIRFNAQRGEYGEFNEETIQSIVERARRAQAHRFERVRPNGTALEIVGAPMPGGGFITTYADVTTRVQAERALMLSRERFEIATDAASIGVWDLDPANRITQWDRRMYQLYGLDPDCGIDPQELWSRSLHPDDRTRIRGEMLAALTGDTLYKTDFRIVWPNGDIRHLHALGRVVKDANGHPLRMTGVNIDITDRKRTEEALIDSMHMAEQASVAKGQFLANMSHEIRTPMNAILGMLKLLTGTTLTERQRDYASKAEWAARSLLELLNDILDFSKVEAGKMKLDPQPFELERLLRGVAVILSATVGTKPIEVLFDVAPDAPRTLIGDAMRLQQVLINLCGNAIKFTEAGEVVLAIRVLASSDSEITLQFTVRDTGIGIAPENQAHIFSGFSQAEASTTRRFGGTGLGLAISSRLVEIMGGKLSLVSKLGHGSAFSFALQMARAEPDTVADVAALATLAAPTTALVVDDNDTAREFLQSMGRSLGWHMETASAGRKALQMVEAQYKSGKPFDAIFLDWQMPGLDGWETAQGIRDITQAGPTPVIVMVTTHGRDMLNERSKQEQSLINGFLVKPVTAAMVAEAVDEARRSMAGEEQLASPQQPLTNRPLAGLRLLLAEDNLVNQQVGCELLSAQGADMVVVGNGLLAVNAIKARRSTDQPFDAILMDLQMPVMDGFTATSQIRTILGPETLPIIAMTANAMASDRAACLEAGMNDHVGKPFELEQLVSTLLHWTGRSTRQVQSNAATAAAPVALAIAELAVLDVKTATQRMGNEHALYARMLERFATDMPGRLEELSGLMQANDAATATRLLHTIKGEAGTLGAMQLAASAAMAEVAYKETEVLADPASFVAHLSSVWQRTHTAIVDTGLAQATSAGAAPLASEEPLNPADLERLRELGPLLQASDLNVLDKMEAWRSEGMAGARWQAVETAVQSMDFAHAKQLCDEWIATFQAS